MLHVKFENCRCGSFIEEDVLNIYFQVLTHDGRIRCNNGSCGPSGQVS